MNSLTVVSRSLHELTRYVYVKIITWTHSLCVVKIITCTHSLCSVKSITWTHSLCIRQDHYMNLLTMITSRSLHELTHYVYVKRITWTHLLCIHQDHYMNSLIKCNVTIITWTHSLWSVKSITLTLHGHPVASISLH